MHVSKCNVTSFWFYALVKPYSHWQWHVFPLFRGPVVFFSYSDTIAWGTAPCSNSLFWAPKRVHTPLSSEETQMYNMSYTCALLYWNNTQYVFRSSVHPSVRVPVSLLWTWYHIKAEIGSIWAQGLTDYIMIVIGQRSRWLRPCYCP